MKNIAAIITARGGSKGVTRKNVRLVHGLPLIAYSIQAALNCPAIDACYVTTEDEEIKTVSKSYGAQVIERPAELATDTSLSSDAIANALQYLKEVGKFPEYFVLLQPTSPLRTGRHLEECIRKFLESGSACAVSITEAEHHPWKTLIAGSDGLKPSRDFQSLESPRQLLPKAYRINGAIYCMASELFLRKKTFCVEPVFYYHMSQQDSLDIDAEIDLEALEMILKGRDSNRKVNVKDNETNRNLLEAAAFDGQIEERVAAGHIPDLRRVEECRYFYNNSWRHPDYVQLDFVEKFDFVHRALREHTGRQSVPKVLEVGCGPGHISLELARNQFDVTGIDLSRACVDTARRFAEEDPWREARGPLNYLCGDFFDEGQLGGNTFDAVVFVGALHHFADQERVGKRVAALLKEYGIIVVLEPTRDRMIRGNAAFIHLVRLLLSQGGGYFKRLSIPENIEKQSAEIERIYSEMRYESESGGNLQSVNDNEAGFREMNQMLQENFHQLHFQDRYAFFHELIGGLRFEQPVNKRLARYLRDMDAELCRLGVLQPTEFFYVGRQKSM